MSGSAPSVLEVRDLVCERGALVVRASHAGFSTGTLHVLRGDDDSGNDLLLRVLGLLDPAQTGEIFLEENPVHGLAESELLKLRERRLGFLFSAPFLLPALTVIENVAMPLFRISAADPAEARARSEDLLNFVGLLDVASTPCSDLSTADQHRVALARSLANQPVALFVERLEPSASAEVTRELFPLLRRTAEKLGVAVIAAVDADFHAEAGDRVFEMNGGAITAPAGAPSKPIA